MQDLIAMLVSTALGTLVGLERQMGRKPRARTRWCAWAPRCSCC